MIKKIKAATLKLTTVMDFAPGDTAQIDFGKGPQIIDPNTGKAQKTWIFVMVLARSRHMYAELVTDQSIETRFGCQRRAFEHFGGVPRVCSIDNLKAAITKACYYDPQVQHLYAHYTGGRRNGINPSEARRRGHKIKNDDPMSGATDDYRVDPETGDVFDPEGEYAGNLGNDY